MNSARTISKIFEPTNVLVVITTIGAFRAGLATLGLVQFFLFFFLGMVLPASLFRVWIVRTKKVSDWDISRRSERIGPMLVLVTLTILDFFLIRTLGNPILDRLFFLYALWIFGFFVITLFWKISGHAGVITLGTLLFVRWFGFYWWPVFFLIPVVCWARVTGRNHTVSQVIGGILYSYILLVVFENWIIG